MPMHLDFPATPTNGQLYPDPKVVDMPQYIYNGYAWVLKSGGGAGGGGGGVLPSDSIPIMDGIGAAGTFNNASRGDHVHPSDTTKANKSYVDSQDTAVTNLANTKVAKTGDVMTGDLIVSSGNVTPLQVQRGVPGPATLDIYAKGNSQPSYIRMGNDVNGLMQQFECSGIGDFSVVPYGGPGNIFTVTKAGCVANSLRVDQGKVTIIEPPQTDKSDRAATTNFVKAWAAPFDVMAYSGMQMNGGFSVNQEGIINATTSGIYFADGWSAAFQGTMGLAVSAAAWGSGTPYLAFMGVSVAQTTMNATDFASFLHSIEGYRVARLGWGGSNARPITIAFNCCHNRVGTYSISVRNSDASRSYVCTYTQNVAGTFEYKTVTVPGCLDGQWNISNGIGLQLMFGIACGSTYTASAPNTWLNGNYVCAPGQVNAVAATGDQSRIANVIILPGTEAPPSNTLASIVRPYTEELLLCKRHWQASNPAMPKGAGIGMLFGNSFTYSSVIFGSWQFAVPMRAPPTSSLWFNGVQNQVRSSFGGSAVSAPLSSASLTTTEGILNLGMASSTLALNQGYDFDIIWNARI